jgi:hypothetical protein
MQMGQGVVGLEFLAGVSKNQEVNTEKQDVDNGMSHREDDSRAVSVIVSLRLN